MRKREPPTVAAAQLVTGQKIAAQLTGVGRLQIAKFARKVDATFAHHGRIKRGITVRRDIPVIRNRGFQTIDVVHAEGRWQEPGFALVAERKGERRNRQQWQALEGQQRALRLTHVFFGVDADAGSTQYPVRQPVRSGQTTAGGVAGITHQRALLVNKVHPLRLAMAPVLQQAVPRIQEKPLKRLHLEFQHRTLEDVTGPVQAHVATRFRQVIGLVIIQPVSTDHHIAAAHLRLALDHRIQVGACVDALTRHKGRHGIAIGCCNGLAQKATALERRHTTVTAGLRLRRRAGARH